MVFPPGRLITHIFVLSVLSQALLKSSSEVTGLLIFMCVFLLYEEVFFVYPKCVFSYYMKNFCLLYTLNIKHMKTY